VISSQGDDHPETNLANSGYMPDMKVEKNHIFEVEFLQKFANKKNTGSKP